MSFTLHEKEVLAVRLGPWQACSCPEVQPHTPVGIVLQRPTADQPYIAGLLDPACNNKLEPNIPAEVLYDKNDDGLDPRNTWKGYYVLL